jgi:2-methylisocitrate lyase-like PEP mutase family enzyme
MPPKSLHKLAQDDTPAIVQVPNTWVGIAAWVAGRFGGSALVAVGLAFAITHIYQDVKDLTAKMLVVLEKHAELYAKNASSMELLKQSLDALTQEARIAHNEVKDKK